MSNVIADLLIKVGLNASEMTKGLKEAQTGLSGFVSEHAKQIRTAGIAMTAFGAATTAMLGLSVKAAEEERQGIFLLEAQLANVGVAYDGVKDSLEKVISATEQKTNFSDDEQRKALGELVLTTGDYNRSLKLLPLALDLAAAKQMDVSTAAELLGKVAQGNVSMLTRYGIVLKEGATAAEALAAVQKKVAGAAEATASPFKIMTNNLNNMKEEIGTALLPALSDIVKKITPVIQTVISWMKENPALTRTILLMVGAIGLLATAIGPLLIALPGLIQLLPLLGIAFHAALGPIGLITIAISAVIALVGALTFQYQKHKTESIAAIEAVRKKLEEKKNTLMAAKIAEESLARDTYDKAVKQANDLYGEEKKVIMSKEDRLKDYASFEKKMLADELTAARSVNSEKISLLQKEYNQKIKTANAEADAAIAAVQLQIDALDNQTAVEDKALRRQAEQRRIIELKTAIDSAQTGEEWERAKQALADYTADVQRTLLLEGRDAEKTVLQEKITQIQANTLAETTRLATELTEKQENENKILAATEIRLDLQGKALDTALENDILRINTDRDIFIQGEQAKLNATLERISREKLAIESGGTATNPEYPTGFGPQPPPNPFLIPGLASGGIVTRPTLAMVGEHGPEAVVPLSGSRAGINITINNPVVRKDSDIDAIATAMVNKLRLQTGLRF